MEYREIKIPSKRNNQLNLKVIPGHFATNHSHVNYYIDISMLKARQSEAKAVAKSMVLEYVFNTVVDTIVCMDGCEVIGAYLAEELTAAGFMSRNAHKTIYVVSPEYSTSGQLIFRDNMQKTIKGKNVILLLASASTGKTIRTSIECVNYYGGIIQGISAIFSAVKEVSGYKVDSIFSPDDVEGYSNYTHDECPYCKQGQKVEAMVNGFGYSKL